MSGRAHKLVTLITLFALACAGSALAATGEIRIRTGNEPNAACLRSPNSIGVAVQIANLSDAVNGVQARLSYNTSLMTLNIGGSSAASGWSIVSLTDSSGLVNCALINNGGSSGPGAGPFTVATLVFAATAGVGSDSINFQADSGPFVTKLTTASSDPVTISGANLTKTPSGLIVVNTPTATASSNSPVCSGGTLNLTGGPGGMASYSWAGPNSFASSDQSPSITNVSTAASGTYTLTVTDSNGCQSSAQTSVTIVAAATANAGPDQSICAGGSATLAGSASNATGVAWSGGGGSFNPNNTTLNAVYTPSAGEVSAGTVTLTLTATGNAPCGSAADSMTITIVATPSANAGPDQSICSNGTAQLAGSASNAASVAWSGGGGSFNPNSATLNAIYTPSAAEVSAGTVTLTLTATGISPCGNAADSMTITIIAAPTANAGPDQSICAGGSATLAGSATHAAGVAWSGGAGSFNPNNTTLNAVYTPSAGEVTAGTVTLTLTATGNSPCADATDSMTITIVASATADAGPDQSICAGSSVTLAGSATHASGVAWSGGAGSFNPDNTTLNATYTPSAGEVTAGTVTLTLTATGNAPCGNAADSMTITIQGTPSLNAGPDQSICAGSTVQLAGSASHATGVAWSGGAGSFNPNNTTLNAIYTPSAGEVSAGTVTLTLSGNAISPCSGSASDSMTISITTTASANAGPDQTICAGSTVQLAGAASNPAGASWSGGGGSFNPSNTALNAIYTPSAAEVAAGTVTLTLTVNAVSPCTGSASDDVTITINAAATADAGPDQSICSGSSATLAGSATHASGVAWSGGTGSFNPNNTTLNAIYTPSPAEVTAGTVTLTLTATGNAPCANAVDSMTITIVAAATANAGPDQTICAGSTVTLAGSATHAAGVAWSGGAGSFNPNSTTLNAIYTPSAGEVIAGTVTLTLTATGNSPCADATDQMTITIVASPTANAGPDQSICAGSSATLAGSATHASGVTWTGGAGSFNPNNTTLNAIYTPSAGEVTAGTVTLTLTATGNSPCGNAADSVTISIVAAPTVNAGSDQTICGGSSVTLAGSASNAASVAWSGGGGSFVPNISTLNAQYTPSASEIAAGSVTLTLTANGNGPCGSVQDSMTITIQACLTVNVSIPGLIGNASEGGHVADRSVEFVLTACPGTTETRNSTLTFTRSGSNGVATASLTNINPATSWVAVREGHTLRKLAAVDLSGDANDTVSVSLISGDFQTTSVSQDNLVDIVDFSILASRWNAPVSDCGGGDPEDCALGGDATGDGIQNTVDFTAIQVNYFQVGDAQDNCPPPLVDRPIGTRPTRPTGPMRPVIVNSASTVHARTSVPVLELSAFVSRVERADFTGDGVVDANDIRAFARANGLVLLPAFEAKLGPVAIDRPVAGN